LHVGFENNVEDGLLSAARLSKRLSSVAAVASPACACAGAEAFLAERLRAALAVHNNKFVACIGQARETEIFTGVDGPAFFIGLPKSSISDFTLPS